MNILIQTLYPAPYRVALFEQIAKEHTLTVVFERDNDGRNPLYCNYSDAFHYLLLGTNKAETEYRDILSNIRSYDLVMLFEYHTMLSSRLILRCMFCKVKYSINCDGAVNISTKFPKKQIKSFFIKHAVLCMAGGKKAKDYFKTYGAIDDQIIVHNFSAIYEDEIIGPEEKENKIKKRAEEGIKGECVAVSVGRLIESKRFDLLIEIWKEMSNDFYLYIIGSGPEEAKLKKMIQREKITNVIMLDFMKRDQLFSFYEMSDLYVFTTATDTWGLVVNEAMAKGLPVISGDKCTAAVEMVTNGYNGYIVNETTCLENFIKEFRTVIQDLLSNDEQRRVMSNNALVTAKEYTYEHMSKAILCAIAKYSVFSGHRNQPRGVQSHAE